MSAGEEIEWKSLFKEWGNGGEDRENILICNISLVGQWVATTEGDSRRIT